MGLVAPWHVGSSRTRDRTCVPALAGGFLTTAPPGKSLHWFFLIVSSSLSKFLIMSINSLNIWNIFCVSWLYYLDPMWVYLHCFFPLGLWSFCLISSSAWLIFFIEFQTLYLKKCQGKVRSKMVFLQREFIFGLSRRLGPLGVLDYISIQRLRWFETGLLLLWRLIYLWYIALLRYPNQNMGNFQVSPFLVDSELQFLSFWHNTQTLC